MIFKNIQLHLYDLELKDELKNSQHSYLKRSGYIIKLFIDDAVGYGEAAPLKNFSKESLKEILWGFEELKSSLEKNQKYDKNDLLDLFNVYSFNLPSLNFGLDIALYDVMAQKHKTSIAKYINMNALDKIYLSSFYINKKQNNSNIVKVKLGYGNVDGDLKLFKNIAGQFSHLTKYRLDFNRAYSIDECIYLLKQIKNYNIQYIEEPLKTLNESDLLKIQSYFPVAIDETLYDECFSELLNSKLIEYVILKPSIYGSVDEIQLLHKKLTSNNINLVFSSSLENVAGNMAAINLAASFNLEDYQGLNNHMFFNYDKEIPYKISHDSVSIHNIIGLGVKF